MFMWIFHSTNTDLLAFNQNVSPFIRIASNKRMIFCRTIIHLTWWKERMKKKEKNSENGSHKIKRKLKEISEYKYK